ncbi:MULTISPECIES: mevalonate kinase [unclassified Streptococcus]|uniref:mevalonate kinase n=1 Tax=unclassified Streptococcus TaxID=2608887 RepID=UPI001072B3DD|nr:MULTISPECIES: mevalonate kinase [unclassified Streptococcus]MBF0788264.1 mevalonate kinase [Streptococcus sp. 19428wC2_LYSM12]MCQ9211794.1 mevalonate kinase [Streptococcus sp. B01]MCQ9212914.1 mevalonate kinase [Streptococcus sp. O1]TFV04659.1 mevalonate kinase [Streptococcus sp. LYSM12]
MVTIGRSTGKIILMGEHAVVYGQPAIAMPFSAVQIIAEVRKEGHALSVSCDFYRGLVHEMPKIWESLKHAIRFSLYRIGAPTDPAIHIEIRSTIPAERGMGSSAAVAVAVARALFSFYEKPLADEELWEIVQSSEKIAHGNPSGIDATTVTGTSPVFFIKNQPIEPVALSLDAYLVVADTGKTGNTLEAITDVAFLYQHHSEVENWVRALGDLTYRARDYLVHNQAELLGQVMNQAQGYLQELTVSDDSLDRLVVLAREKGALGAKLTGGGRGGCMIALAKTREDAKKIAQSLAGAGASQTWIQYLGERHE